MAGVHTLLARNLEDNDLVGGEFLADMYTRW